MATGENMRERELLEGLDRLLFEPAIRAGLQQKAEELRQTLGENPEQVSATATAALELFGDRLPDEIKLCRVFLLRAGAKAKVERHTNSIQRLVCLEGAGKILVLEGENWRSQEISSDPAAGLEERWCGVAANIWHQPAAGRGDWVTIAFHTAAAEELIDEYQ